MAIDLDPDGLDQVFAAQDTQAMVDMAAELVEIPSATGDEETIGNYVAARFSELGLSIELQEVEQDRSNVVARLPGTTPYGKSLMMLAHFDTSTVAGEALPIGFQPKATLQDGWMYGLGISNMKCAFAGFWSALQMLRDTGVSLSGEVIVAGVVGEILKAPIDEWQGQQYRGGGSGAHYMLSHGVMADYCINGEPTGLRLQPLNGGYAFLRISIAGSPQEAFSKDMAVDPIPKAFRVHEALSEWESSYQQAHRHDLIRPQIVIGSIFGGYPFKPHITAPFCNLYLHVQTVPDQNLLEIRREVEEVVRAVGRADPELDASVSVYLAEGGYELDQQHPLCEAVRSSHARVFGTSVTMPNPERCAISSDNNSLAVYGVPAVTYGAGGINLTGDFSMYEPGLGEVVKMDNLAAYARVCAASAVALLGRG